MKKTEFQSRVSDNLSVAKGISALIVMAGHLGTGIPKYWVIVAAGLLVFSISSAYFTFLKYKEHYNFKQFWVQKRQRLLPKLIMIDLFLFLLFLYQEKEGLWSWQSIFNAVGLNGFLNWFLIHNPSPYGAGMWFFTLLLLFYLSFPLIKIFFNRAGDRVAIILSLCFLFLMNRFIVYGHALWLTTAGFFVGVFFASTKIRLKPFVSISIICLTMVLMALLHFVDINIFNFFFILIISSTMVLFLFEVRLPRLIIPPGKWLSALLLEIYLLHPYLEIHPTGSLRLDQSLSVVLIIFVAYILSLINKKLTFLLK